MCVEKMNIIVSYNDFKYGKCGYVWVRCLFCSRRFLRPTFGDELDYLNLFLHKLQCKQCNGFAFHFPNKLTVIVA